MVRQARLYGMTVNCYKYYDDNMVLVHKKHLIATDRDMVKKLALDYIYEVQYDYDDFEMVRREVMTAKEQFAH